VYGKLRVKLQLVTSHGDIVVRKMEVVEDTPQPWEAKPVNSLSVTLIQLTSWPEQELPHPTAILSLIDHLTNAQMSSSTKRTVVMCRFVCKLCIWRYVHITSSVIPTLSHHFSDGVGRTGTFICIHSQLERLKTEGVVDIFQAIKSLRMQRNGVIPNVVSTGLIVFVVLIAECTIIGY